MSDPLHDPRRLAALAQTGLMDSAPEEVFDRLTRLASRILDAPLASISLVDGDRQFFKSVVGSDRTETPLSHSFCRYVVADAAPLAVADARRNPQLQNHPATRELGLVAYCGVPLTTGDGHTLGTLCVASGAPRAWSEDDVAVLSDLAAVAITELELRSANHGLAAEARRQAQLAHDAMEQHRLEVELARSEERFRRTFDHAPNGLALVSPSGRFLQVNRALCEILGYEESELLGRTFQELTHPDEVAAHMEALRQMLSGERSSHRMEKRYLHPRGHVIWARVSVGLVRDEQGEPMHFASHIEDITAAKEVELALREGRRMLNESQAVAGVGSWSWNLETGEATWSAQQFALYGIDPSEGPPSAVELTKLLHPDNREQAGRSLAVGVSHRGPFTREHRVVRPDGTVRVLCTRGDFLPADPAAGRPARLAGTTQDVTAERLSQAAQREVESRHRVLLSSLPDTMVVLYDRDLRCVLFQGSDPDVTAEQYEGKRLTELVAPERYALLEPHVRRALAGEAGSLEYRAADGRSYHTDVVPYRPDGDAVSGVFTVWRDITRDRDRERQARKLATIVQQSADAILAVSLDGTITEWNGAATQLYGYSAAEALGQQISILAGPAQRDEQAGRLAPALTGGLAPYETTRMRKDGSIVDVSVSVSPLHDADGSLIGLAVSYRDVSERRQMENELRASREQALEASRLKSEFVANMSHEIRTPLNGVVSMAELLLDTQLTPEQTEYAHVALTSAEALMRVIDDILDFSKIEAGKLEIVTEDFPVGTAVSEVCEILAPQAAERGLDLRLTIDEAVAPVVRGDANRVRQVLMNLLSNAVKFTSEGQITVRVDVHGDAGRRAWLRLRVTDTGIGIAPDRLPHLFQPFSQADATTTRRYGGTGLGLCISKQLVELMGGEIDCRSVAGHGSTFQFTIPYFPSACAAGPSRHTDLTGSRVLVVAESTAQRRWLQDRLASWGISPDSTADPALALQLLRRGADGGRPYEAAVITHGPGGVDGLALARAIKEVPALRAARLILVTPSEVDAGEAAAAGVDGQVVAPIRQSVLYDALLGSVYHAPVPARPSSAAASPGDAEAQARPRVLVAEDNEVNQFAAIRLLQTFGLLVDIAKDGREAVTMTARRNYAAVFMDCQMPDVDGYMATRAIRWRERGGTRTPIIALTAHALEGDREKCLEAGMDDYLTKPLRLQMVEALMQRMPALRPHAARTGAAAPDPSGDAAGPVFDPAALRELDDPETEAALAMMFLDQASDRLPALREAIQSNDSDQVHALAHGLKGTAATVGALRISELSRKLCHPEGETLTPEAAAAVHARLTEALAQTRAAVEGYLEL